MLNMLLWFLIIFVVSFIFRSLCGITPSPLRVILGILAFGGVFIHELAHLILCLFFRIPVSGFHVKFWSSGEISPHGSVNHKSEDWRRTTLLQNLVVSIAPLLISTWLFLFCLDIIYRANIDSLMKICISIFMISLLIGASPSLQDFRLIRRAFSLNPRYSLYQVILCIISFIIVWITFEFSLILLPYEVLYYVLFFISVIFSYFALKYGLRLITIITKHFHGFNRLNLKTFSHQRHRALHPKKLGIKEAHW